MFEQLFKNAFTITRHKAALYAVERERYLEHHAKQGYPDKHLRQLSGMLLRIVHELKDYLDLKVGEEQIRTAAQRVTRRHRDFPKIRKVREFRKIFAREAKRWLRFWGRFQETGVKLLPFADLLDNFTFWMVSMNGDYFHHPEPLRFPSAGRSARPCCRRAGPRRGLRAFGGAGNGA